MTFYTKLIIISRKSSLKTRASTAQRLIYQFFSPILKHLTTYFLSDWNAIISINNSWPKRRLFISNSHKRPMHTYTHTHVMCGDWKNVKMIYQPKERSDVDDERRRPTTSTARKKEKHEITEIIKLTGGWRLAWYYFILEASRKRAEPDINKMKLLFCEHIYWPEIDYHVVTTTIRQ